MPWYADWFDRPEYEWVYRRRDEDEAERAADFIERVAAPEPGACLLDVGCGRGRHARVFARRGYRVTGIDLSRRALATARRRAKDEDLSIDFRRRDMRAPMGHGAFDGVVNLFSSFGYFHTENEHQQVIDHVAEALRPGGFFVQDFLNAHQVRASLVPENTRAEDGHQITERRWIEAGRIEKEITIDSGGDGTAPDAPQIFRESVRLLERDDFRRFYERAGLRLERTFGNYDGAPFEKDSPRLIMVSRRVEGGTSKGER